MIFYNILGVLSLVLVIHSIIFAVSFVKSGNVDDRDDVNYKIASIQLQGVHAYVFVMHIISTLLITSYYFFKDGVARDTFVVQRRHFVRYGALRGLGLVALCAFLVWRTKDLKREAESLKETNGNLDKAIHGANKTHVKENSRRRRMIEEQNSDLQDKQAKQIEHDHKKRENTRNVFKNTFTAVDQAQQAFEQNLESTKIGINAIKGLVASKDPVKTRSRDTKSAKEGYTNKDGPTEPEGVGQRKSKGTLLLMAEQTGAMLGTVADMVVGAADALP